MDGIVWVLQTILNFVVQQSLETKLTEKLFEQMAQARSNQNPPQNFTEDKGDW